MRQTHSPEEWIAELRRKGYRSAYAPIGFDAGKGEREEYRLAAADADIVIAEVGAWSNPLSPDRETARAAREKIVSALELGEDLRARCVANIAGSRGTKWDGPDPVDYERETFDMIVSFVQSVLDEVAPKHTSYGLEPMPWMYPDSPETYRQLIEAIDRPAFGVHYDPVNLVNSPRKYANTGAEVEAFIAELGPLITSVHVKDIRMGESLTVHLDECIPGEGGFDHETLLRCLSELDADLPILVEHLKTEEAYDRAVAHIRSVAARISLTL